ncbi:Peroxiredoxin [Candidatus Phaeomarinobacter ectocarpi]|uniref:thioredoxin-dependent peroxiredoxin n=1 Tax=Candidatus Phaeomarinibacter ectocarpi TaxID=1458461 RepID=X5MKJ1_9HYPH|nr:peroxiredoxin-like family protein [Candidatus Phaeomarinobacter ectocarpi]CDO58620.1 Peroxiredoxin [Candidatus Phaeomarinobacter ectocarpi]
MSLQTLLEETRAGASKRIPEEALAVMRAADEELVAKGVGQNALKVGDTLPDATFTSATGDTVQMSNLLANGPLIINFYRGGWCPYCNFELKAYQDILGDITALGAQLVAVTPEKPDNSLSTTEKNALTFPVLTDNENAFAKALGIAFELPKPLQELYGKFGMDLPGLNAGSGWSLPIPATFVVDANGKIVLADVDVNYTRRLEPSDALTALKASVAA